MPGTAFTASSRVRRWPSFAGRKPAKKKASEGSPLAVSAARTAEAPGTGTTIVETADKVYLFALWVVINLLPDFTKFNDTKFVAEGFNVPAGLVVQHVFSAAAYLSMVCVLGYFFLKTREVAR